MGCSEFTKLFSILNFIFTICHSIGCVWVNLSDWSMLPSIGMIRSRATTLMSNPKPNPTVYGGIISYENLKLFFKIWRWISRRILYIYNSFIFESDLNFIIKFNLEIHFRNVSWNTFLKTAKIGSSDGSREMLLNLWANPLITRTIKSWMYWDRTINSASFSLSTIISRRVDHSWKAPPDTFKYQHR